MFTMAMWNKLLPVVGQCLNCDQVESLYEVHRQAHRDLAAYVNLNYSRDNSLYYAVCWVHPRQLAREPW